MFFREEVLYRTALIATRNGPGKVTLVALGLTFNRIPSQVNVMSVGVGKPKTETGLGYNAKFQVNAGAYICTWSPM